MVIRRKIKDKEPQSLIKADIPAQKVKNQEKEDIKASSSDKKAFLNPDKDKAPLDETESNTGYSRAVLAKSPEIAVPKKLKRLESIEKQAHSELQTESKTVRSTSPLRVL